MPSPAAQHFNVDLTYFHQAPAEDVKTKLLSIQALANRLVSEPTLSPKIMAASRALLRSLDHLLTPMVGLPPEYLAIIQEYFSNYPGVLMGEAAALGRAEELQKKLLPLQEMVEGKINATQERFSTKAKMLGDYLLDLKFATRAQLEEALADQKSGQYPGKRVGDILQAKGIITRSQLDQAIEAQMLDHCAA